MMATETEWNIVPLDGAAITEDLAARLFVEHFKGQLLFCHSKGVWYEFDGNTWIEQKTPKAFNHIRNMCRRMAVSNPAAAGNLAKVKFVSAVETFSRADPLFARSHDDWNKDKFLLGTPGGTVDLTTGQLRDADPKEMINRSTAVSPDPAFEDCPLWQRFLEDTTAGDEGLIRFLQQMCGYALTGDASEQCLFFIHGEGGRGKGVFLHTIRSILGSYAKAAAMDTFEDRNHGHTTSVAELNGARLVTASETEEGRPWSESRIKLFTGEDPITARFMRRDNITFEPEFTPIIIGNHEPALKTVDEAMRRRFNIIPFTVKPPRKDPRLREKLKSEWPGILRWMINGCLDWRENGLIRPEVVIKATASYFEEQDIFGAWLRDYCDVDADNKSLSESSSRLFRSYSAYCKASGESAGTQKTFGQAMRRAHFPSRRTNVGIFYSCIALKGRDPDRDDDDRAF